MSSISNLCVSLMIVSVCLCHVSQATYIDCSMECLFAAFRPSHVCDCKNNLKLHWGKRAPRTRSHSLPTFRYGKRASPFVDFDNADTNRLDTLRLIREALGTDAEYDA